MTRIEAWIAHWGYAAIFLIILLGNIGVPVPEETILLLSGYLAWLGDLSLTIVIPVGILSAVVGDNIGYWLGRTGGRRLILAYGRYVFVSRHTIRRAERLFDRYGSRAVFLGRFVAGVRFLAGPLAGVAKMPFGRFFAYNAAGALVYVSLVSLAGYAAGPHLQTVLGAFRRAEHWVAIAAALLLVALAWRFLRRKKE